MRGASAKWLWVAMLLQSGSADAQATRSVEVPIGEAGEVRVAEVVSRLAKASGVAFDRPVANLSLSTRGLARGLTKALLSETLGPEVAITFQPGTMVLTVDDRILAPARRVEWLGRLRELADRATEAARRRDLYGMRALPSYRPNDPARPTLCLVHGLNSSSGGFVHMIPWLEEAGYGIVVYDYPFNRRLEESCAGFAREWAAFRRQTGDHRPWAIVAHSMGALLARSLVEDDATWSGDVSSLVLIAPVNQGSNLARVQTVLQLVNGLQSIQEKKTSKAMMHLSDGLGQAAQDMLPGSAFLTKLNRGPRRNGLPYHIISGDVGFLTREARAQIEARVDALNRGAGLFGRLAQAASADLPEILDELTDGTGDGGVAVKRTRLDGVPAPLILHANHAELIRAPLLFADPGPVPCMPDLLRLLEADRGRMNASRGR